MINVLPSRDWYLTYLNFSKGIGKTYHQVVRPLIVTLNNSSIIKNENGRMSSKLHLQFAYPWSPSWRQISSLSSPPRRQKDSRSAWPPRSWVVFKRCREISRQQCQRLKLLQMLKCAKERKRTQWWKIMSLTWISQQHWIASLSAGGAAGARAGCARALHLGRRGCRLE